MYIRLQHSVGPDRAGLAKVSADRLGELVREVGSGLSGAPQSSSGEGFEVLLTGGPTAGSEARRAVLAGDGSLPVTARENLLLLVTELVNNSVRHAPVGTDGSLRVAVRWGDRRVRVEVEDPGRRFTPARPRHRPDGSGGWGLVLVDRIADDWGVSRTETGTSVWFELELLGH